MTNYELVALFIILILILSGIGMGIVAHFFEEGAAPVDEEAYGDASTYGREKK